MAIINNHKLEANSHGGAEVFLEKFEQAIQDMKSVGTPYDAKMAKINLLNNITDDQYSNVVENLRMNSTITYQDSLLAIRRKSITVESNRKSNPRRRTNNLRQPKKWTQKTNTKPKWFLPRETWDKMSAEERKAHRTKICRQRNEFQNSIRHPTNPHQQMIQCHRKRKKSMI